MATGGSGCMEMAVVSSLHDVLHATVFQIIGMATHRARGNTFDMTCIYIQWGRDHNLCYTFTIKGYDNWAEW